LIRFARTAWLAGRKRTNWLAGWLADWLLVGCFALLC